VSEIRRLLLSEDMSTAWSTFERHEDCCECTAEAPTDATLDLTESHIAVPLDSCEGGQEGNEDWLINIRL